MVFRGRALLLTLLLWLAPFHFAQAEFNYEELEALIRAKDIRSIEALLPLLPKELRSNFNLMYESRGLQNASFKSPRVILVGEDAKLLLAFSGDPTKDGYQKLEIIQFRDTDKRFEMREIEFPANPEAPEAKPRFSQPNPPKCLECHRNDPRPNWDRYAFWKGAFGSKDDEISKEERKPLDDFLKSYRSHPRYSQLIGVEEAYSVSDARGTVYDGRTNGRLNIKMTQKLAVLNWQRIVRKLQAVPNYERLKYAIMSALVCGSSAYDLKSFFPESLRGKIPDYRGSTYGTFGKLDTLLSALGVDTSDWSMDFDKKDPKFNTPASYLEELPAYLTLQDKAFEKIVPIKLRRQKNEPEGYGTDVFATALTYSMAESETCQTLRLASLEALKGISMEEMGFCEIPHPLEETKKKAAQLIASTQPILEKAAPERPAALNRCMNCHGEAGAEAPYFDLGSESKIDSFLKKQSAGKKTYLEEIRARIAENASDQIRMPPDGPLSEEERRQIEDYLKSFMK